MTPADVPFAAVHESASVQVFGRRDDETDHALKRPATKKRQSTKSRRQVVGERCRRGAVLQKAMGI